MDDPAPILIAVFLGATVFLIIRVQGALRRGRVADARKSDRCVRIKAGGSPDDVFALLRELGGRYVLHDADPVQRILVLATRGLAGAGYFHYVWVSPGADGGTVIEAEVEPRDHRKGLEGNARFEFKRDVAEALAPPAARVTRTGGRRPS